MSGVESIKKFRIISVQYDQTIILREYNKFIHVKSNLNN